MLKCLKFEMYKLMSYKTYPIVLAICIILTISLLNNEAKMQLVANESNISVTQDEYNDFLEKIENSASEQGKVSIFQSDKHSFSSRNIEKTAKDMRKMQDIVIESDNDIGINIVKESIYPQIITMFIMIMAVYIVFFKEKEVGIYPLIKTTSNGNTNTYIAKILILLINSFFIQLMLFGVSMIVLLKYGGYGDLERSIQSVRSFMYCDIKCNIIEMLTIVFLLRFVGAFVFSLCVAAIALKTSNSILFVFTTLFSIALNYILTLIPDQSAYVFFKHINLINIFDPCVIFSVYRNINILSYPVNVKTIIILLFFVVAVVNFMFGLMVFKRRELVAKKINVKKYLLKFKIMENCKSIFLFELYKLSFINKVAFVLLIFIVVGIVSVFNIEYYKSPQDYYYGNYIEVLQGELTEEKIKYIEDENKKIEDAEQAIYALNEKYNNGEISLAQLQNGLKQKQVSENRKMAFKRILLQYEHIISNPEAQFIYDTGYKKLFNIGEDNQHFGWNSLIIMFVLIVLCSSGTFTVESKKGMSTILASTPNGTKKTMKNKIVVSFLHITVLFFATCFDQLLIIKLNYGINDLTAPLCSLQEVVHMPNVSILSAIIIKYLVIYMLCICITVFSLFVSNIRSKKSCG